MCVGVTIGLARMKFSGSPNTKGKIKTITSNLRRIKKAKLTSLVVKYQWKGMRLYLLVMLRGLLLPDLWRKKIWIITTPNRRKGLRK